MNIVSGIQERRGIIEISADGCTRLKVRKTHFAKRPLEIGEAVDFDQYEQEIAAVQFSDAYEAALTSLDFSARTAREIERCLLLKGYVQTVVSAVVERLTENRLLDDRQIAGRIAEANSQKAVGIYAIKRKLRAKGISEEDVDEALGVFDDEQQQTAARQAAEKLYRKYSGLPRREARMKLSQALARRGFSWDAIKTAVDNLLSDDEYFDE